MKKIIIVCSFFCSIHPSLAIFENYKMFEAYKKGDYKGAQNILKTALVKDPSDASLLFDSGDVAYRLQEYDQAAAYFTSAAKHAQDPAHKEKSFYNVGNTYVQQKKYEEAIKAYDEALALIPDDSNAQHNKKVAEALLRKQKEEEQKKEEEKKKQEQQKQQEQQQEQKENNQCKNPQQSDNKQQQDQQEKKGEQNKQKEEQKQNQASQQNEQKQNEQSQNSQQQQQQDQHKQQEQEKQKAQQQAMNEQKQKQQAQKQDEQQAQQQTQEQKEAKKDQNNAQQGQQGQAQQQKKAGELSAEPEDKADQEKDEVAAIIDKVDGDSGKEFFKSMVKSKMGSKYGQKNW